MSKVDAMRALREARMSAAPAVRAPVKPAPVKAAPAPRAKKAAADPAPAEGLCGHRSMNGRSCTRAGGHAEKNHRYG